MVSDMMRTDGHQLRTVPSMDSLFTTQHQRLSTHSKCSMTTSMDFKISSWHTGMLQLKHLHRINMLLDMIQLMNPSHQITLRSQVSFLSLVFSTERNSNHFTRKHLTFIKNMILQRSCTTSQLNSLMKQVQLEDLYLTQDSLRLPVEVTRLIFKSSTITHIAANYQLTFAQLENHHFHKVRHVLPGIKRESTQEHKMHRDIRYHLSFLSLVLAQVVMHVSKKSIQQQIPVMRTLQDGHTGNSKSITMLQQLLVLHQKDSMRMMELSKQTK